MPQKSVLIDMAERSLRDKDRFVKRLTEEIGELNEKDFEKGTRLNELEKEVEKLRKRKRFNEEDETIKEEEVEPKKVTTKTTTATATAATPAERRFVEENDRWHAHVIRDAYGLD